MYDEGMRSTLYVLALLLAVLAACGERRPVDRTANRSSCNNLPSKEVAAHSSPEEPPVPNYVFDDSAEPPLFIEISLNFPGLLSPIVTRYGYREAHPDEYYDNYSDDATEEEVITEYPLDRPGDIHSVGDRWLPMGETEGYGVTIESRNIDGREVSIFFRVRCTSSSGEHTMLIDETVKLPLYGTSEKALENGVVVESASSLSPSSDGDG